MSNQYYDEITDKLSDVFINYRDELLTIATNIYHNTDTDKDIEDIVIDLQKHYHQKVLDNKMSIEQVRIDLYRERCNTIYDY